MAVGFIKQGKYVEYTRHYTRAAPENLSIRNAHAERGSGEEDHDMKGDLVIISLAYKQKFQLHYLVFNLSISGITGLKRHQKDGPVENQAGWRTPHLPIWSHTIRTEKYPKPAQWIKEGTRGRQLPHTPGAPLGSARGSRRLQDHQTRRLRNRLWPRGVQLGLPGHPARSRRQESNSGPANPNHRWDRATASARWLIRRCQPGPRHVAATSPPRCKPAQGRTWRGSPTAAPLCWLSRWRCSQRRAQWRLS